tara:strand:- start:256 stop:681 length:426 start_codon:yes stop_codon:yes gene_type:complete
MDNISIKIINFFDIYPFKFSPENIDNKILKEVKFFQDLLKINMYNTDVFHSYINKILETWKPILKDKFEKLVSEYNIELYNYKMKQARIDNEMVKMADDYQSKELIKSLDDLEIDPINFLSSKFKRSNISKKKQTKRRKLK